LDYFLIDLYKTNYNPVLSQDELYTKGNKYISPENLEFQRLIKERDKLIFIYPIWWGSMPAILKGFLDRVFTPNFGFYYKSRIPIGLLKDKRALVFSTSGAPGIYNLLTLNRFTRPLTKDVLRFCGIRSKSLIIGSAFNIEKRDISRKVLKSLDKFI